MNLSYEHLLFSAISYQDLTDKVDQKLQGNIDYTKLKIYLGLDNDYSQGGQIDTILKEWKVVKSVTENHTGEKKGFYAVALQRVGRVDKNGNLQPVSKDEKEVVVAIRGSAVPGFSKLSDTAYDWIDTNIVELPLGPEHREYAIHSKLAEEFTRSVMSETHANENQITVTGHSMGGALAQRVVVDLQDSETSPLKIKGSSFNGPGMLHGMTDKQKLKNENNEYNIMNYVVDSDVVGTLDLLSSKYTFVMNVGAKLGVECILAGTDFHGSLDNLMSEIRKEDPSTADYLLDRMKLLDKSFEKWQNDPEYRVNFMKHIGQTRYVPGFWNKIPHALSNFDPHFDKGNQDFISTKPIDMTYNDGRDVILATHGNDKIYTKGGNDEIFGEEGNDLISAGEGNDILNGGKGDDTLIGGPGLDQYIYTAGDGNDTIIDDGTAGSDLLELVDITRDEVGFIPHTTSGGMHDFYVVINSEINGSIEFVNQRNTDNTNKNIKFADSENSISIDLEVKNRMLENTEKFNLLKDRNSTLSYNEKNNTVSINGFNYKSLSSELDALKDLNLKDLDINCITENNAVKIFVGGSLYKIAYDNTFLENRKDHTNIVSLASNTAFTDRNTQANLLVDTMATFNTGTGSTWNTYENQESIPQYNMLAVGSGFVE